MEDGGPIVGDDDVTVGEGDHLIHAWCNSRTRIIIETFLSFITNKLFSLPSLVQPFHTHLMEQEERLPKLHSCPIVLLMQRMAVQ